MNFIEKRNPAGNLTDIRVQHIGIEALLRLVTKLPNTAVISVTKSWPPIDNEAARFQIGRYEFIIETSFADMFISPTINGTLSEEFEKLADHLRIAKDNFLNSLP